MAIRVVKIDKRRHSSHEHRARNTNTDAVTERWRLFLRSLISILINQVLFYSPLSESIQWHVEQERENMDNINPIAAQSDRKPSSSEHDKQEDDEFEDSLNISISEQISEEIEDNSNITSAEDSIEQSKRDLALSKRRQLFNIGNDDEGPAEPGDELVYSKFDIDNDAALLSGVNIAQHFKVDDSGPAVEPTEKQNTEIDVSGVSVSQHSLSLKITEEKSSEVEAAENDSVGDAQSAIPSNADQEEEGEGDGAAAVVATSADENDVILINDHEISICTLKKLQTEQTPTHSASDPNVSTNQNTTSDISDLLNENSPSQNKEEIQVKSLSQSEDDLPETGAAKSNVVTNSASIVEMEVETFEEKQQEMKEIINEAVDKLPIGRSLGLAQSATVGNSATTTDSEPPASSAVTEINYENNNRLFEKELDVNLLHMQNKIQELQSIAAGKYHLNTVLNLPTEIQCGSSSRRDSLKDFPQSGRESTSITTNSTEYKTFQEEYLQVSSQ